MTHLFAKHLYLNQFFLWQNLTIYPKLEVKEKVTSFPKEIMKKKNS